MATVLDRLMTGASADRPDGHRVLPHHFLLGHPWRRCDTVLVTPEHVSPLQDPAGRSGPDVDRGIVIALGVLAAHNLAQNLFLNERGYISGNLVVSAALLGIGRSAGLSWQEIGIELSALRPGLRIGLGTATLTAAGAGLALAHPRGRAILEDKRAMTGRGAEVWQRALLRFPLGTALFEEVAFRGVLTALLRRAHPPFRAEATSVAAFALWHVIPTGRALTANPLTHDSVGVRRLGGVAAGSVVAGLGGIIFGRMRRSTGSLLAPWLAHSSFNTISYLSGVAALRLAERRRRVGSARYVGSNPCQF